MGKPPKRPATLSLSAYRNILACTDVSISVREQYLETIANAGKDVAQAKLLHDAFRNARSQLGPPVTPLANEGFGNFASIEGIKHFSYRYFNPPGLPTCMDYPLFRKTVEGWIGFHESLNNKRKPTSVQRLAAIAIQGRNILVRHSQFLWLFRNPKSTPYAFEGLLDKWLSNRLGLAAVEPRLTLNFPTTAVTGPCKPTFLDARWEDLDYWDASGKTRPIAGTPKAVTGLEEVVATPPKFEDIHGPVHKI